MELFDILLEARQNRLILFFVGAMMFCVVLHIFDPKKDYKPIIISLGVLGTFIGIFLGLWDFKTEDISKSVPKLLEGLKMAFFTSIAGMFFSVCISICENLFGSAKASKPPSEPPSGAGHSMLEALKALLAEQKSASEKTERLIEAAVQSKENINIHFKNINQSLQEAIKTLSKGATEEIIGALKKVISDFNSNLTDQFGENFKQLNEAVKSMIVWQNHYRESIELTENKFMAAADSVKKTSSHTEKFAENYEKISQSLKDLRIIIETNQNQIQNLESGLSGLKKIGEEAGLMTNSIGEFSETIQSSLSEQSQGVNKLSRDLADEQKKLSDARDKIEAELKTSLGGLNKALTALTEKFREDYKSFLDEFKKLLDEKNTKQ